MSLGGNASTAAKYMMIGALTNVGLSVAGGLLLGPWAVAAATAMGCVVTAVLVWRATRISLGWSFAQVRSILTPPLVAIASAGLVPCGYRMRVSRRLLSWRSVLSLGWDSGV